MLVGDAEVTEPDPVVVAQVCVDGLSVLPQEAAESKDSPMLIPQCSP